MMLSRMRTTWLAGSGALFLALVLAGAALGAPVLTSSEEPAPDQAAPLVVDTAPTFEDADGDSIDDDCDADVVADVEAAAAAAAAVDTNADGVISVREAAQSERIGGANCNHGGYVSTVAQEQCDAVAEDGDPAEGESEVEPTGECVEDEDEDADPEGTEDEGANAECVPVAAPTFDPERFTGPGAFGAYVASVAASDAVGGKNCNHGGAVSEAVKAAREAARAERDAAKAERRVQRDAAKAERRVQRDAAEAERAAAKNQGSDKGKGQGQGN
jgi:hypothetical protein